MMPREAEPQPQPRHAQAKDASLSPSRRPSVRMNKGKIMRKLLGQPAPSNIESISIDNSTTDSPQLRPSASQNTTYSTGAPVACLDRSSDGNRAVVAGVKVFKILRVDGPTITEELDLRSAITSYAVTHDLSAATPDQLNIKAVKWSHGTLDTSIITASGNGRITVYDLNRVGEGVEIARIQEHARQVHKLAVNPFMCNWLLSASQDGTVRSFDIRAPFVGRNGPTFRTWQTFKCNADAVRDVKWSPTDGMEFACCTDAGVVQKWDIRKPSAPVLKLTAHQSPCFSISWHPDGDHLTSGGADQFCHVWDLSKKADRNQKPRYTFATPAPISTVIWRPACWSATAQGRRAAQITIAYDDTSIARNQTSTVDLWDLARPSMPFKQIEQWDSSPTSILWNSRDLLWAVDREGHFTQTDVAFTPKAIDRRNISSFSFSPSGDVLMLLEERQIPRRRSRPLIKSPEVSPNFQNSSGGTLMSVSQSDSEEDVVGSFLGPRQRKTHRRRTSARSTQSFSTTPPSNTGIADKKVMTLDEGLKVTGLYKPQQVMAIGHAPSTAKSHIYQYFSNRYLMRLEKDNLAKSDYTTINVRMSSTTEHFARTAESAGQYRLAQTWRLLGYTMNLLLTRRAEYHRQSRLAVPEPPPKTDKEHKLKEEAAAPHDGIENGQETPQRQPRSKTPHDKPLHRPSRSTVVGDVESTSNVATPLARPVDDDIVDQTREAMLTPISVDEDVLNLPEAAHSTSPGPIPVPRTQSNEKRTSSIEGYDFYGIDTFSPSVAIHASQRKQPLRLDYTNRSSTFERQQLSRHDSGESFQMFSTSADSHQAKFSSSSGSDAGRSLRDRVSSWENSLTSNSKDLDAPPTYSAQPDSDNHNGVLHDVTIPPVFHIQEASVKLVGTSDEPKSPEEEPISPSSGSRRASQDPNIIESDYLPWPSDPSFTISPIDPAILVQRSIDFETKTSALNAAAIVLLLRPLLPTSAIDGIQATAILRQFHHRLTSMKLFTEATLLRNLCVPLYPSVFAPAQENTTIGYFCTSCQKPLENDPLIPNSVWYCPRCEQVIEGCAVCRHRELETNLIYEDQNAPSVDPLRLWWLCPGCGHGGHTACMQAWHSGPEFDEGSENSGGCCPLEGCLHPCIPGTWRAQRWEEKKMAKARELESLVRESSWAGARGAGVGRGGVRRDNREVNQSKAVEGVRVALGVGVGGGTERGPVLERKKSVKLIAPGEEGG